MRACAVRDLGGIPALSGGTRSLTARRTGVPSQSGDRLDVVDLDEHALPRHGGVVPEPGELEVAVGGGSVSVVQVRFGASRCRSMLPLRLLPSVKL